MMMVKSGTRAHCSDAGGLAALVADVQKKLTMMMTLSKALKWAAAAAMLPWQQPPVTAYSPAVVSAAAPVRRTCKRPGQRGPI